MKRTLYRCRRRWSRWPTASVRRAGSAVLPRRPALAAAAAGALHVLGSVTGVASRRPGPHLGHASRRRFARGQRERDDGDTEDRRCCAAPAAPFILEFDTAGKLLSHFGGPGQGYQWPQSPGGITADAKGNVWIAGGRARAGASRRPRTRDRLERRSRRGPTGSRADAERQPHQHAGRAWSWPGAHRLVHPTRTS